MIFFIEERERERCIYVVIRKENIKVADIICYYLDPFKKCGIACFFILMNSFVLLLFLIIALSLISQDYDHVSKFKLLLLTKIKLFII